MINRILVGIDFSEASRLALERAAGWAEKLSVPLVAMHVLQAPAPMLPEAQIALPDPDWLQAMEGHAKEQLDLFVRQFPGVLTLVNWGSPAEELVAEATPDCLLVVAQVGHSGIERLLFGSTAARVVKHAPCDVLVVRGERAKKRKEH
jgi:universal stress protein A